MTARSNGRHAPNPLLAYFCDRGRWCRVVDRFPWLLHNHPWFEDFGFSTNAGNAEYVDLEGLLHFPART